MTTKKPDIKKLSALSYKQGQYYTSYALTELINGASMKSGLRLRRQLKMQRYSIHLVTDQQLS